MGKQQQTQSLEEATEQIEPAFKISPPSSPSLINNNNNHNNNNSNNLPIPANFPDQQSSEAQLQLPFNPENGQLALPLVTHSQDSVLCTSYTGGCHVGDYPMMTATTESVFLNLLVKNEPEDLTGHRERQGEAPFSPSDTYAVWSSCSLIDVVSTVFYKALLTSQTRRTAPSLALLRLTPGS